MEGELGIQQPFPFLKLPSEIRDIIYYYAQGQLHSGSSVIPTYICYMNHNSSPPCLSSSYWGTEKSTRLFRVNRQVSAEALEVFYSTFEFHFPQTMKIESIEAIFHHTLNSMARNLMHRVGFGIVIRTVPNRFSLGDEEGWRRIIEVVTSWLPNIKRAELTFSLCGDDVPELQVNQVLARFVRIASPLKGLPYLVIRDAAKEGQQERIMERVRRELESF